ncbi:3'-5' exonuclease [Quatrionicoccus australiensis]|uniref:3'-5' exonuclease n=1 Tax=Quatrionicoccus australiensis TaxID=138118 RepID=UPI001CFADB39|nr:3'-5' exonuclease [Quatrionicoccus australiensis]MCB4358124.1 3'-5' exonuclease domain-containing protein 2 [Quatrionicoccus australiensis]
MSEVVLSRSDLAAAELPLYPGIGLAGITLVTSAAQAGEARVALMATDAIGFDTESKPTFLKGEVSTGPHLIQLATDEHAYLFPVTGTPALDVLKAVLEAPGVLKVGFGLGNDRSALHTRLNIALQNVLDLGEELRGPGHRGTVGAKVAVAHYFGQKLQKSKKIGTSNWANARLNERQILYAANDAHVALRIYRTWRQNNDLPA